MSKPKAIIIGPAERIEDYYIPRAITPPCVHASPHLPGGTRLTQAQAEEMLDAMAAEFAGNGYRIVRVKTMAERDAVLTFVREAMERSVAKVAIGLSVYGNENNATR